MEDAICFRRGESPRFVSTRHFTDGSEQLICVVSRVHQILGGTESFVSPSTQVAVLASVKSELKLFETKYRKQLGESSRCLH